jgi:hypothetical protein
MLLVLLVFMCVLLGEHGAGLVVHDWPMVGILISYPLSLIVRSHIASAFC